MVGETSFFIDVCFLSWTCVFNRTKMVWKYLGFDFFFFHRRISRIRNAFTNCQALFAGFVFYSFSESFFSFSVCGFPVAFGSPFPVVISLSKLFPI